jgi:hypothetical protein
MTLRVQFILRLSLLGFLTLTILLNCYAQDTSQQSIIARIDGKYAISFADIERYVYDSHLIYKYRRNKAKAYRKAVDEKIMNQLKLIDFFALGLDEDAEILRGIKREINEEVAVRYYETQFYERYVNEDSVRSLYRDMGKEVIYQQIVLAKPKHATPKDLASLRSRANRMMQKIRNGADVAELARDSSQNAGALRPGVFMPPLTWKMSLASDLSYAIFHLAAHDVRAIESKESISIVNVAEVRTRDVPPYEQVKEDIRRALGQRYGDLSLREFERTKKNLIDEKTLAWNPKALQQLVRWSNLPHFYETGYADTLRKAISHGRNLVILRYAKGRVDLSEYLRLLDDVLTWGNFTSITENNIKKYILEAVRTDILAKRANALNLKREIFNAETTNPVLRNEILRLYDRHEIEDRIPAATEKALREFYQAHRESLFYQLAKVNIYAVIDSSKKVVDEAKQKLEQNVPFEKLAPEIFVKTYVRGRDGTFDTYLVDEPPYLGEAAFKLKLYETAGPIDFVDSAGGKQYALIKCVGIREEKQLSYEDVEKTIPDDFRRYYREELTRATQDHLKKKYTVTVYTDVLNRILAAIGSARNDR